MNTQIESTLVVEITAVKKEELNLMQERLCGQVAESGETAEVVLEAHRRQFQEGAERTFAALFVP